ncbi:hypothetical protein I2I11_08200 [Pontibacter sp. 172403-2]|uniref:hypothetical protein n=1 Tax=Pontibacter rufus TaxID=2791028 RepID=UPI0018AFC328|nr:hypothetical protein [Pontibacter sp. 172403-2]MBF9253270.1 hypothetical protein [Pontibacter sp. 172403-2]
MKKLTLVAAAVLSAAATFAQTNTTQINTKAQTAIQISADGQNRKASASHHTSGTAAISEEGTFVNEAAVENAARAKAKTTKETAANVKAKSESQGKAVAEVAQHTTAAGSAKGKVVAETAASSASLAGEIAINATALTTTEVAAPANTKDKPVNHGQVVAEAAHNAEATTTTKGQLVSEVASAKGKLASEITGSENAVAQVEMPDLDVAPQQEDGKAKAGKEKASKKAKQNDKDNHGQVVSEVAQTTQTDATAKGQVVKEVATAKRQKKPVKLDSNIATETTTRATGAARVVTAGRPASAGRPARVLKAGGAVKPVKVNGKVKVGSVIKVGN